MVRFTKHALEKFEILKRHGFQISKAFVREAVVHPEVIDHSRLPLKIAQRTFDKHHVLRVVYREVDSMKLIVTFYPGRKSQYEKRQ